MLSEDAIEKLVQPIVDRQQSINSFIIQKIARKIKEIGKLSPSDVQKLIDLRSFGGDVKLINAEIARLTNLQVADIKSLIRDVALDVYLDAKPFYDYRHKAFIPFDENKQLQKVVQAISKQTAESYINLSNSKATGYMIPNSKGVIKFHDVKNTYTEMIDKAIQANLSGIDYGTAMRTALTQLTNSGLSRLYWDSGYNQRLDTAVRRNVLDGIREINQGVHNITGEQFDSDGKEITVHENSALDHEPFQGHQFTNAEWEKLQSNEPFQDIEGNKFEGVRRIIGQWNCRHFAYSIIIGFSKPNYTDEQLQAFIQRNHKGYTLANGKHLTLYECTQMQRRLETRIRYAKENKMALDNAGLDSKIVETKIKGLIQEYLSFSDGCGLIPRLEKTYVAGYK